MKESKTYFTIFFSNGAYLCSINGEFYFPPGEDVGSTINTSILAVDMKKIDRDGKIIIIKTFLPK